MMRMFWKKKNKLAACYRPLCGAALPERAGQIIPEDTGPEIDAFLYGTVKTISIKADVEVSLFTARCKTLVGSDVEIQRKKRGYDITFYTGLLHDPRQTSAVVDHVVGFIRKNPLTLGPVTVKQVGPQALLPGSYFAFLFVPASQPLPSDRDLDFMARAFVLGERGRISGWRIFLEPYDDAPRNSSFMTEMLEEWFADQEDSASIKAVFQAPVESFWMNNTASDDGVKPSTRLVVCSRWGR
jgi:hypothetical protein